MQKRLQTIRKTNQNSEVDELIRMACALTESCNLAEDQLWQNQLTQLVEQLLSQDNETTLNTALDTLAKSNPRAWNGLADIVESCSETFTFKVGNQDWQSFLLAVPLLAWSRYNIPSGPLGQAIAQLVREHLSQQILASGTRVAIADILFSPDQLPQGYCQTQQLTQSLSQAALQDGILSVSSNQLAETKRFLSDTRYILAVVSTPRGSAFLRWQEKGQSREEVEKFWKKHCSQFLSPLFNGCAFEPLLPIAYFAAWRAADQASRAYSIHASCLFLQITFNIEPNQLSAVIAPCHQHRLEEYRIGFLIKGKEQLVHGVVWPLLDGEDEHTDCFDEIEAALKDSGIQEIIRHEHSLPLDYCEDCDSPLFPNKEGDLVHADAEQQAQTHSPNLH